MNSASGQGAGKHRWRAASVAAFVLLPVAAIASHHHCGDVYRYFEREPFIVVDTKDCSGNTGLASFRPDRVFKIQVGNCRDPDDSTQPIHQVLLRSLNARGSYDVIWVDSAGVQSIREQLEENRQMGLQRRQCNQSGYRPAEVPQPKEP